jgi:hypothetical protein
MCIDVGVFSIMVLLMLLGTKILKNREIESINRMNSYGAVYDTAF